MRQLTVLCVVLLLAIPATLSAEAKKKFGGNAKNSEYEGGDYESDYEYDDQGNPPADNKATEKPSQRPAAAAVDKDHAKDKENGDGKNASSPAHSLFAPRRNRKPFSPQPSNRPKPTLPSFIRNPANPASLTTHKPRLSPVITERPSTSKPASSRTTTSRPNKAGGRRGSASSTSSAKADDDSGRRFGGTSRNTRGQARPGFRSAATA